MVKRRREPEVQPYTAVLASQVQSLQTEVGSIVQMLSDIQNAMAASNTAQAMATNQTPIDPDQAYAISMGFAPMYQQSVQAAADRAFQLKMQEEQQKFQTAERIASQQFQAAERTAAQAFQTGERTAAQQFQTTERVSAQTAQEDLTRLQVQIQQEASLGFKLRFTSSTGLDTEPVLDAQGNKIRWASNSEYDLFLRELDRRTQAQQTQQAQEFQTSERVAAQTFQQEERLAAQAADEARVAAERGNKLVFDKTEAEDPASFSYTETNQPWANAAQQDLFLRELDRRVQRAAENRQQAQVDAERARQIANMGNKLVFTVPETTDPTSLVYRDTGNPWASQAEQDLFLRELDRRVQRGIEKRQQEFAVAQAEAAAAASADRTDASQYLGDPLATRIPDDKKTPLYNACKNGETDSAVYRDYNLQGAMIYNSVTKTFHRSVCDAVNVNQGSYANLYYLREDEYKAALSANNEQGPYTPEELAARGVTGRTARQVETGAEEQAAADVGCPLQGTNQVPTCEEAGLLQHEDGVRGHCYDPENDREVSTYYIAEYDQCSGRNDMQGGEVMTSRRGTNIWLRSNNPIPLNSGTARYYCSAIGRELGRGDPSNSMFNAGTGHLVCQYGTSTFLSKPERGTAGSTAQRNYAHQLVREANARSTRRDKMNPEEQMRTVRTFGNRQVTGDVY